MRKVSLSLPEIGIIGATRGLLGAGAAFLLADRVSQKRRRAIGLALLFAGLTSTVPLVFNVVRKSREPFD